MQKLRVTELPRLSIEEFKEARKIPLVIVLDNVRSLNNVGSIFRTADAFRVEKIFLCGITSAPPSPEIHKTALGAENSVTWEYCADTATCVEQLIEMEYTLVAVEQARGSVSLIDYQPSLKEKYAIVLGNEVRGIQQQIVDKCHMCLEIPQYGTKHSLNVSIAAGIVIWTFFSMLANL